MLIRGDTGVLAEVGGDGEVRGDLAGEESSDLKVFVVKPEMGGKRILGDR